MGLESNSKLVEVLGEKGRVSLNDWKEAQWAAIKIRREPITEEELYREASDFMSLFQQAVKEAFLSDIRDPVWLKMREMLSALSISRARRGFTPTEMATFVLSFKQPLFEALKQAHGTDSGALLSDVWMTTVLLDKLGLYCVEEYQKTREAIISRQQKDLLELSTPVVQLWPGVLTLPLIGTLDSERTQLVMERLLQKIVDTGSQIAIIDITGVPTVDTLVAQHLMKTIAAAHLMGAECFLSGISPQIAQTVVHLGVKFGDIVTKATLADAFGLALKRIGLVVIKKSGE